MLSKFRRRITFANVTAVLALVFAMSGGAYAATHYKITSTKQISPKVLKSLKGAKGAKGARGPAGAAGAPGAAGAAGAAGTAIAYGVVAVNSVGNPAFLGTPVGFTTVTHPGGNIYCIGPAVANHPILLTPAGTSAVIALGPSEQCTSGYQIETSAALTNGQGFVAAIP